MDDGPAGVDGFDQTFVFLVRDQLCRMPSRASIKHMEDDVLVDEQEVALRLLVETVWQACAACVAEAGLRPGPADPTSVNDFWN